MAPEGEVAIHEPPGDSGLLVPVHLGMGQVDPETPSEQMRVFVYAVCVENTAGGYARLLKDLHCRLGLSNGSPIHQQPVDFVVPILAFLETQRGKVLSADDLRRGLPVPVAGHRYDQPLFFAAVAVAAMRRPPRAPV